MCVSLASSALSLWRAESRSSTRSAKEILFLLSLKFVKIAVIFVTFSSNIWTEATRKEKYLCFYVFEKSLVCCVFVIVCFPPTCCGQNFPGIKVGFPVFFPVLAKGIYCC